MPYFRKHNSLKIWQYLVRIIPVRFSMATQLIVDSLIVLIKSLWQRLV